MIAKLTGLVDTRAKDHAIVDVNGVGYLVRCSARTLDVMPAPGGTVSLSVDTLVREDAIDLYGFATLSEHDWFRLLMTVQGVGAKVALSLLSALTPDELARAIANDDKKNLTRADGVGPKLAGRLANELKDKVGAMPSLPGAPAVAGLGPMTGALAEAVSALVNLGYRRAEAANAVESVAKRLGPGARVEALIPAGLKELSA